MPTETELELVNAIDEYNLLVMYIEGFAKTYRIHHNRQHRLQRELFLYQAHVYLFPPITYAYLERNIKQKQAIVSQEMNWTRQRWVMYMWAVKPAKEKIARLEKLVVEEKKRAKETVNVNKGLLVKGGRILHHLKAFLKGRTS